MPDTEKTHGAWKEGEYSCDCLRQKYFNIARKSDVGCVGASRFIVVDVGYEMDVTDLGLWNSKYNPELIVAMMMEGAAA